MYQTPYIVARKIQLGYIVSENFQKKGIGEKTGCTEGNQKKEAGFFLSLLDSRALPPAGVIGKRAAPIPV